MAHIQCSAIVPADRQQVFDFLSNPNNLEELLQDHIDVDLLSAEAPLKTGTEYGFMMTRLGLAQEVRFEIQEVLPGSRLTYRQTLGLFKSWVHTQKFEDHGQGQTRVTDIVEYQLPFGLLGYLADDLYVRKDLTRILKDRLERAKGHFDR